MKKVKVNKYENEIEKKDIINNLEMNMIKYVKNSEKTMTFEKKNGKLNHGKYKRKRKLKKKRKGRRMRRGKKGRKMREALGPTPPQIKERMKKRRNEIEMFCQTFSFNIFQISVETKKCSIQKFVKLSNIVGSHFVSK